MDILVIVEKQRLRLVDYINTFVEGSQQFIRFKFNLSEEWNGLTVFAQFVQNGKGYNQYLDNNNCAYLPKEIVAGSCNVVLYGTGSSTIGTTNYLNFKIDANKLVSDGSSIDISETLYQQLVERVDNFINESTSNYNKFVSDINMKFIDEKATIEEVKTYMKI